MGSPLSPVIANFFMEDFEKKATEQATHKSVRWFRYVDDTFVIWPPGQEKLTEFLNHLNGLHNKIQFTMETEEEGHLPFLVIDIYRKADFGNPPKPISTYTIIPITIPLTNNQSSLPWYIELKLSVTSIPSPNT